MNRGQNEGGHFFVGKTIEKVYHSFSGDLYLFTTDGLVLRVEGVAGYDGENSVRTSQHAMSDVDDYVLCEAGFISEDEYGKRVKELRRVEEEREKQRERQIYEALKVKFDGV